MITPYLASSCFFGLRHWRLLMITDRGRFNPAAEYVSIQMESDLKSIELLWMFIIIKP